MFSRQMWSAKFDFNPTMSASIDIRLVVLLFLAVSSGIPWTTYVDMPQQVFYVKSVMFERASESFLAIAWKLVRLFDAQQSNISSCFG